MNYKNITILTLTILVVLLIVTLVYKTTSKDTDQTEQATNEEQSEQRNVNEYVPQENSSSTTREPASLTLPSYCLHSTDNSGSWVVSCAGGTDSDARGFMSIILKPQGWTRCESNLGTATWWKGGILTTVIEGSYDVFTLKQRNGEKYGECL